MLGHIKPIINLRQAVSAESAKLWLPDMKAAQSTAQHVHERYGTTAPADADKENQREQLIRTCAGTLVS